MRFQQVHTFYKNYLDNFYCKYSHLAATSFQEQITALVRDGFSGCHMFAPYMDAFGYDSQLIIANCLISQAQWLKENNMYLAAETNWVREITRRQVDAYNPDILYLSDSLMFDSHFVRSLKQRPRLILGFRGASFEPTTDLSEFDILLSNSTLILQQAKSLGARKTAWFYPGMPSYFTEAVREEHKQYDVVFTGSWSADHQYRNQLLQIISDQAATGSFTPQFFLNSDRTSIPDAVVRFVKPALWGMDMFRALKRARIVFNADLDFAGTEAGNMRLFETTAVGSFILTQHHDNICEYFEPGIEVETYRSQIELYEKICYYLEHPEKREEIARRGQERALREYTMEVRAQKLNQIINSLLAESIVPGSPAIRNVEVPLTSRHADPYIEKGKSIHSLKADARLLVEHQNYSDAFAVLIEAKALKLPLEGLDVLRARCFMEMGQYAGAIEALQEELRWFPANHEAREMLEELHLHAPTRPAFKNEDEDFYKVFEVIRPYTMLSEQRLYSLYCLARNICENSVQGNFVECGVAAGGSSALLAWVIKKYSLHPRRLFSFDSFSGMPRPSADDTHQGVDAESTGWGTGTCSAPEESVKEICMKLGVEDVLVTVKGYFEDTLPQMRDWVGMVALLHMDGDWYESTRSILDNLYDRLTNGALVQVDDYGYWDGCRKAMHEFATTRALQFDINQIDSTGVWFVKPDTFRLNPVIPMSLVDDFMQDDPVTQGIVSQMSANERFQLYYAVRTLLPIRQKPVRFIEIGSYSGASLRLTCQALGRLGVPYQGVSVEPIGTSQFREVIESLKQNVVHLPMFSHEASPRLGMMFGAGDLAEFIFVDGDHTYEGVKQDIIDYYQLLAPGGIILFHDFLPELDDVNRPAIYSHHGNAEPGIRKACKEVLEDAYRLFPLELPLLYPDDPTQTQAHLPIIPEVFSTVRAYRKPLI